MRSIFQAVIFASCCDGVSCVHCTVLVFSRSATVGQEMEQQEPASAQDLALPAQGAPGVQDSSELGLGLQAHRPPTQPAPRSLGRKTAHESCDYRPPLWSMSLGDPHGQWLKSDSAARSKIRSSAPSKTRVSNDALIVCEDRLREHVYALIEGEEYDSVSRSW